MSAPTDAVTIRPLGSEAEARECALMMASTEPWVTLGRTAPGAFERIRDPEREVYVVVEGERVAGFIILCLVGAFTGYIQSVCVHADRRGRGLGSRLIAFAEERILRDHPNVFLCVSSFNHDAQRLYQRLGYDVVGSLDDFVARGHAEILMRKTIGPLREFRRK